MKKEIENREDLYLLVSKFYVKLLKDDNIKHFFDDMVKENTLEDHLQILVDFWDNILFYTGAYRRNAMRPHLLLNQTKPFQKEHFKIWLNHFNNTLDENFTGQLVHAAKTRAQSIAMVMELKVNQL
ncbi:MAG TPA: group III truncated hemoglobin [Flavobacteriaceae bacterium]|nr:group III truncated hemoglobin [Flavobacteriaceae bacterium]